MTDEKKLGGIKGFIAAIVTAVLTSPAVQGLLRELIQGAVADVMDGLSGQVTAMRLEVEELAKVSIDQVDALDGKMGNLQEQLAAFPGQVIGGIITELRKLNPLNWGR